MLQHIVEVLLKIASAPDVRDVSNKNSIKHAFKRARVVLQPETLNHTSPSVLELEIVRLGFAEVNNTYEECFYS